MIGIRIANGDYYPIMEDDPSSAKRLVLTTVKDDQKTVHIDLYRGDEGFAKPEYLGSLVIEGISGRPKQVPDIELVLGKDENGELQARASDRESGKSRSLSVSLGLSAQESSFDVPDFELDSPELDVGFSPGLSSAMDDDFEMPSSSTTLVSEGEYAAEVPPQLTQVRERQRVSPPQEEAKPRMSPIAIVAIIAAGIAALLLLAFIVYKLIGSGIFGAKALPSPQATIASPEPTASPTASPLASVSPEASFVAAQEQTPEPSLEPTIAPTPALSQGSKGLWHRIRWGDTLWDIATRYYGNPWLYKKIAKANNIRNPDLIISGTRLWVPPR